MADTGTYVDDLPETMRPPTAPPWEDVAESYKQRFPLLDQDQLRVKYTQAREYRQARIRAQDNPETTQQRLGRSVVPYASTITNAVENVEAARAQKRIEAGNVQPGDYDTAAAYEHLQKQQEERTQTLGGKLTEAALTAPAMIGEFMTGGAALKAAGMAGSLAGQSLKVAIPTFGARLAATTVLAPSTYAKTWVDNNKEAGRDPLALAGFPAAFGLGMVQNAILGSLGNQAALIPALAKPGATAYVTRQAVKGGLGAVESQAADLVTGSVQDNVRALLPILTRKQTHYGTVQDLLDGKAGEALKTVTAQALTFAMFGMMHDAMHGTPTQQAELTRYQDWLQAGSRRGLSARTMGEYGKDAADHLGKLLEANPDPDRAQVRQHMEDLPPGPSKELGLGWAKHFPEKTKPEPTPETAPPVPQNAPGTPQAGQQAPTPAQPAPGAQQATPAPAAKASPVDALTFSDLKGLAKSLGIPTVGLNRKGIFDVVRKKVGNDAFLEKLAKQILEPPAPPPVQKPATYPTESGPGEPLAAAEQGKIAADQPSKAWPKPEYREKLVQRILGGESPEKVRSFWGGKTSSPMWAEVLQRVEQERGKPPGVPPRESPPAPEAKPVPETVQPTRSTEEGPATTKQEVVTPTLAEHAAILGKIVDRLNSDKELPSVIQKVYRKWGIDPGEVSVEIVGGRAKGKAVGPESDVDVVVRVEKHPRVRSTDDMDMRNAAMMEATKAVWDRYADLEGGKHIHVLEHFGSAKQEVVIPEPTAGRKAETGKLEMFTQEEARRADSDTVGPFGVKDFAGARQWEVKDKIEAEHYGATAQQVEVLALAKLAKDRGNGDWAVVADSKHAGEVGVWSWHGSEPDAHRAMMQLKQDHEGSGLRFSVEHRGPEVPTAGRKVEVPQKLSPKEKALHDQVEKAVEESDTGHPGEIAGLVNKERGLRGERKLGPDEMQDVLDSLEGQQRIKKEGEVYSRESPAKETGQVADTPDKMVSLNDRQRHVLEQRALGRAHEDIGTDPVMHKKGGLPISRERVRQIEAEAIAKMGGEKSAAEALKASKVDKAVEMAAKGETVAATDLHADLEEVKAKVKTKKTKEERELETMTRAFLEEAKDAKRRGLDTGAAEEIARNGGADQGEKTADQPSEGVRGQPGEAAPGVGDRPTPEGFGKPLSPEERKGGVAGGQEAPGEGEIDQLSQVAKDFYEQMKNVLPGKRPPKTPKFKQARGGEQEKQGYSLRDLGGKEFGLYKSEAEAKEAKNKIPDGEDYNVAEVFRAKDEPVADFGKPLTQEEREGGVAGGQQRAGEMPPQELKKTDLSKEQVEIERRKAGREQLEQATRKEDEVVAAAVDAKLAENPNAGFELVRELQKKPRPLSDEDAALLVHHKTQLRNQYDRLALQASQTYRDLDTAKRGGGEAVAEAERTVEAQRRVDDVDAALNEFDKVVAPSKTATARGLRWLGIVQAEDFSLHGMRQRLEMAKKGPLTKEESEKVAGLHERIKGLQEKIKELEARGGKAGTKEGEEARERRVDLVQARREYKGMVSDANDASLSPTQKVLRGVTGVADTSRGLITGFDLSYLFRQGAALTFAHPVKAFHAFVESIKAFGSERAADRAMDEINQRANSVLYRRAGVYLAEPEAGLSGQEEAFIGRWVGKIPGLAGSQRAYTTFLNRMRADVFDSMLSGLTRKGRGSDAEATAIANYVNVASGRGKLNTPFGSLEDSAVTLSRLFFSPRFVASRFQLLTGEPLWGGTRATRGAIALEYARFGLGLALFYGMYLLADDKAKVSFEPRSSDFGKIVTDRVRIDPMAGLAQDVTLGARSGSGQTVSSTGKTTDLRGDKVPYRGDKIDDLVKDFVRRKFAPVPGAITNMVTGEDALHRPTTLGKEALGLVTPLAGKDVLEALQEQGAPRGIATGILALLGMGSQVYEPRKPKKAGAR